jgi:MAE_28990/MAE_18760-like HEPN
MKIRTVDQLQRKIDDERVWRIREIAALNSQCFLQAGSASASKALRRSFIPIAYAHWEGFVKKSAHYYVEFVAMQGLSLKQLSSPFMSMYLVQKCAATLSLKGTHSLAEVCKTLMAENDGPVRLIYNDVVYANSNLNSEVLKSICDSLGLDYSNFEVKKLFIDVGLVKKRNKIAHGELQDVEASELEEVKDQVVNLIDLFKTEIENSAALSKFRTVHI